MKIKFLKSYAYSPNGYNVVHYDKGEEIDTEDKELIRVAKQDKVITVK